jgi:hypothetical protein
MGRIYARSVAAQMIERQAIGNPSYKKLINDAMRELRATSNFDDSIARAFAICRPFPTIGLGTNFLLESDGE